MYLLYDCVPFILCNWCHIPPHRECIARHVARFLNCFIRFRIRCWGPGEPHGALPQRSIQVLVQGEDATLCSNLCLDTLSLIWFYPIPPQLSTSQTRTGTVTRNAVLLIADIGKSISNLQYVTLVIHSPAYLYPQPPSLVLFINPHCPISSLEVCIAFICYNFIHRFNECHRLMNFRSYTSMHRDWW